VVSDPQIKHVGPGFDDRPAALVAQDERHGELPVAVAYMQVRVAHPGGGDAHPHLAGAWCSKLNLLDHDSFGRFSKIHSAHLCPP